MASELKLLHGRICMGEKELELLRQAVQEASTYLEIGTLWGGSLISALQANPELVGWAIDPMDGYYGGPDQDGSVPDEKAFWENIRAAGVGRRVHLVIAKSHPFPQAVMAMQFDVVLIDGDHTAEGVERDWKNAAPRCKHLMIFHDIDDPAIMRLVDRILLMSGSWMLKNKTRRMAVLERIHAR